MRDYPTPENKESATKDRDVEGARGPLNNFSSASCATRRSVCVYIQRERRGRERERERKRKRRRIGRQGTYSTAAAGAYSDDEEDVACIIVRRGVAVKKKKKEEEEGLATSVPAMEGRNTPRRVARARGPRHILSFFLYCGLIHLTAVWRRLLFLTARDFS